MKKTKFSELTSSQLTYCISRCVHYAADFSAQYDGEMWDLKVDLEELGAKQAWQLEEEISDFLSEF